MRSARQIAGSIVRSAGIDPKRIRHRFSAEAPATWYDEVYADSEVYSADYRDSPYLAVWEMIADLLGGRAAILEIGCGSGQLAQLLDDRRLLSEYVGFDFSSVAVSSARARLPDRRFEVDDALSTDLVTSVHFDTVICTEVLEHIRRDRAILRRIPSGTRVLATVPDFPSRTHVRWFASEGAVVGRYGALLSDLEVRPVRQDGWTIYVLDGVVR